MTVPFEPQLQVLALSVIYEVKERERERERENALYADCFSHSVCQSVT